MHAFQRLHAKRGAAYISRSNYAPNLKKNETTTKNNNNSSNKQKKSSRNKQQQFMKQQVRHAKNETLQSSFHNQREIEPVRKRRK